MEEVLENFEADENLIESQSLIVELEGQLSVDLVENIPGDIIILKYHADNF